MVSPSSPAGASRRRAIPQADRRQAILDAALDVFSEKGFAAARLEDVATRAGIAKGTIYLYFDDKRALFMDLVRGATAPMFARVGDFATIDAPVAIVLRALAEQFLAQVLGTRRKEIFRLVIAESGRFPEIARFYHAEVISRMAPLLGNIFARAAARGERVPAQLIQFPHLFMGPFLLSILWDGMFSTIEPLDAAGLLAAHIDMILGGGETE